MSQKPVYLDYNATAPLRPAACEAMQAVMDTTGNPSSVHGFGRAARGVLERARAQVAALVAAAPAQVVFTSGGTEANNLAITCANWKRVLVSAGEHDSVLQARPNALRIPLQSDGCVDLSRLEALLSGADQGTLVSVMLANNETGVIQPLREVVSLAKAVGARVHCDAVQAAGKIAVSTKELGVDLLTLSAHKLGGPPGVGALVVAEENLLHPLIRGGGQERGRRAGTENLIGIAGFGAAASAVLDQTMEAANLARWRDAMERELFEVDTAVQIFGRDASRLANTSCFALPGFRSETLLMALDLAGVAVSAGAACSSGKVTPSHVLTAMGASTEAAAAAIRVSLGYRSQAADIDRLLSVLKELVRRRHGESMVGDATAA